MKIALTPPRSGWLAATALLMPLSLMPHATAAQAPEGPLSQRTVKADDQRTSPAAGQRGQDSDVTLTLGPARASRTYVVQLEKPAVPERGSGLSRQAVPSKTAWRRTLKSEQTSFRTAMQSALGHAPQVSHTYTEALNGFGVRLTGDQATQVSRMPGVIAVTVDEIAHTTATSNGADWIKSDSLWAGASTGGVRAKGEGVVIGVIDSGINPANPSFAANVSVADGGDDHVITNPRGAGNYLGMCNENHPTYTAAVQCNDKLIGVYNLTKLPSSAYPNAQSPYDDQGHGSHTAATAAGNRVRASWPGTDILPSQQVVADRTSEVSSIISGVAPHANLISYDVCALGVNKRTGCSSADIVSAYEQAILDQVDVINFSIGSATVDSPWVNIVAQAQLNARRAGISVAGSAGNHGPGDATISSYGDVPWVTSVANATHDLDTEPGEVTFTRENGDPLALGPWSTNTVSDSGTASARIVRAADVDTIASGVANDGFCMPGTLPSAAVTGAVVVCDRGNNARSAKGRVVKDSGGVGMILANAKDAENLLHDIHVLPTAHITRAQGADLAAVLLQHPSMRASITGGTLARDPALADTLNASSSRGPTRNGLLGIGPSLTAPGTDVLAAGGVNNSADFVVMSGTSMAAPHVAGAMALLKQLHPAWSDAQITSALMTTASTAVRDIDDSQATWFEMGSGRVDLARAAGAGLLMDTSAADFEGADPALGGDPTALNSPQISDGSCWDCVFTREFTATSAGLGTWGVTAISDDENLSLSTSTSTLTMGRAGQQNAVTVTAQLAASQVPGTWHTGTLKLTAPASSGAPDVHLPIAIMATNEMGLSTVDVSTHRSSGTHALGHMSQSSAEGAQIFMSSPVTPTTTAIHVPLDLSPDTPFNSGSGTVHVMNVAAGTAAVRIAADSHGLSDLDLYVGEGSVPQASTQRCASTSADSREECVLSLPAEGQWWILVQNVTGQSVGSPADLAISTFSDAPAEHFRADVGASTEPGEGVPLTLAWDAPLVPAGTSAQSAVVITSGSRSIARLVTLEQHSPEVAIAALPTQVEAGDTLTGTVTVQPDQTGDHPVHNVSVELPEGWTVRAPVSAGGSVRTAHDISTVTWRGSHRELALAQGGGSAAQVMLTFDATVTPHSREGDTVQVRTRESVTVPGGGSSSTRTDNVRVVGGVWPSTVMMNVAPETAVDGATLTASATISSNANAIPTGTVEFLVNEEVVGQSILATTDGVTTASGELRSLDAGNHAVTARYLGDESHLPTTSAPSAVRMTSTSSLVLSLPQPSVPHGQQAEVSARIGSTLGARPTGSVTFLVDDAVAGTGVVRDGEARWRADLPAGSYQVRARYDGDELHSSSTTAALTLTVTEPVLPEPVVPDPGAAGPTVPTPTTPTTPAPTPAPGPTPAPTASSKPTPQPNQPNKKPSVTLKAVAITAKPTRTIRRGKSTKPLVVRVRANSAKPRGTVRITVKGAGRTIVKRLKVPASGMIKLRLGTYRKAGKVRVKIVYSGDAKTRARTVNTKFTVKR